jgi:UrcA family protein
MTSLMKRQFQSIPSIIATMLVAFAGLAKAGGTAAAEPPATLSKRVTFSDLNLDTQAGANALYARLRYAAGEVCEPYEGQDLSRHRVWKTCVDQALAAAVAKINKPRVTALHNQNASRSGSNGNS